MPDDQTQDDRAALGAGIRSRRTALGLTLVQVAERSGLSHPFLSQIERGLARPSLPSLARIARALGSSQLELLEGGDVGSRERAGVQVLRADTAPTGGYGSGQARLLATGATRFIPLDYRGEGRDPGEYFLHDEDEFVTVIAGSVDVDLGDEGHTLLGVDDSLYFPGGTPHRWSSADGEPYRMIVVKERRGPLPRSLPSE